LCQCPNVTKTYNNVYKVIGIYHNTGMKRTPSSRAVRDAAAVFMAAGGTLRTREVLANGIHPSTLYGMRDAGLLEQLSRGVYRLAELEAPSRYDMVAVSERVPGAVICLLSALDFHEIGTQIPAAVTMAVRPHSWRPVIDYPPVRYFQMSMESLSVGVEEHLVAGTTVRVFNPAKTVADCFKFRNKVGLDVALEALRESLRHRRATREAIMKYAEINRVSKIVRPYLEAME